jgi:hypothetical protein
MNIVYLVCFVLGFLLSVLAAFSGLGRVHFGHLHFGHAHLHTHAKAGGQLSALNGFTLPAFLCWFGGTGYLLHQYSSFYAPLVLLLAVMSGLLARVFFTWRCSSFCSRKSAYYPRKRRAWTAWSVAYQTRFVRAARARFYFRRLTLAAAPQREANRVRQFRAAQRWSYFDTSMALPMSARLMNSSDVNQFHELTLTLNKQ